MRKSLSGNGIFRRVRVLSDADADEAVFAALRIRPWHFIEGHLDSDRVVMPCHAMPYSALGVYCSISEVW
jgi:hypothetical protein